MKVDWHASILFIRQLIVVRKLEAFQNHTFQHITHIRIFRILYKYPEYAKYVKYVEYGKYVQYTEYVRYDVYVEYAKYEIPIGISTPLLHMNPPLLVVQLCQMVVQLCGTSLEMAFWTQLTMSFGCYHFPASGRRSLCARITTSRWTTGTDAARRLCRSTDRLEPGSN